MKILYEEQFKIALKDIVLYIKKDNPSASLNFKKELKRKIENIPNNPKIYRASIYYDNNTYRDLVFKGYTIIYKIDKGEDRILILDIFKWVNYSKTK